MTHLNSKILISNTTQNQETHHEQQRNRRQSVKISGLDLSLTATGIATIDDGQLTFCDCVRSSGQKDATLADRTRRLFRLRNLILDNVRDSDIVVIEGPAFSRNNSGTWDRAGLWWLVVGGLDHLGIPVVEVPPTTRAKWATDRGNAGKTDVAVAVSKLWTDVEIRDDNQADALVLASIGAVYLRQPVQFRILERHRLAMSKLAWPDGLAVPELGTGA